MGVGENETKLLPSLLKIQSVWQLVESIYWATYQASLA